MAFNSAFKDISKLVQKGLDKIDAKVAYLKTIEEQSLYPHKSGVVSLRGKNKEIDAKYQFMSE